MFIDENSKPKEKLKAWYLFTEDFVAGTQHLTNEQIGIYIRLLCWNWNKKCEGIPNEIETIYRIANAHTESEKKSCRDIIKEFFHIVNDHLQNPRQLQEYLYITKRIEASKINGRLGGRPKQPSNNPPTQTLTHTPNNKNIYSPEYEKVWLELDLRRGSKYKGFQEYQKAIKLTTKENIIEKYNYKIANTNEPEKYVPHFSKWLKDRLYEEEITKKKSEFIISDPFENRIKMFVDAIKDGKVTRFLKDFAIQNKPDIDRGIRKGYLTKEQAINDLGMKNEYIK